MIPMNPKHTAAPTPAEAIAPAPEAVLENDIPQMPEPGRTRTGSESPVNPCVRQERWADSRNPSTT